jgi:hypothetical protein
MLSGAVTLITVAGPPASGKSALAQVLAAAMGLVPVRDYGALFRTWHGPPSSRADFLHIGQTMREYIGWGLSGAVGWGMSHLICDTDVLHWQVASDLAIGGHHPWFETCRIPTAAYLLTGVGPTKGGAGGPDCAAQSARHRMSLIEAIGAKGIEAVELHGGLPEQLDTARHLLQRLEEEAPGRW